jgi:site-specific recombinase XerD
MLEREDQNKQRSIVSLVNDFLEYLKVRTSDLTFLNYTRRLKDIIIFFENHNIDLYCPETYDQYVKNFTEEYSYRIKNIQNINRQIRVAYTLLEFKETGKISYRRLGSTKELTGNIGKIMEDFITFRQTENLKKRTIESYTKILYVFNNFLSSNNIYEIKEINTNHIFKFIKFVTVKKSDPRNTVLLVKSFLKYVYENGLIDIDLTYIIPKGCLKNNKKLPSLYSQEEIEKIISAVDCANPKGKRDYAMVLLAARLGLRASDICRLKFENLHWDKDLISINQYKTDKLIELPMLPEIGNALIDYLKYGRPKSDEPYIFLHLINPFTRLKEPTLHSIVFSLMKLAGIKNLENRKHGPHALRHSLAGALLEIKTPITIISEVLGHSTSESTKDYLRIDLKALSQCVLEVPDIDFELYMMPPQKPL